jgi:uncharacterized protein (TIGR00290 family)
LATDVKIVMNWSSGKDAALAYHLLTSVQGLQVTELLTTLSLEHERVFMHGVRESLLDMQAERMGLPLTKVKLPASPDDGVYKEAMSSTLSAMKGRGITTAAYGDIFLEDLKQYREQQLAQVGLNATFPLWQMNTADLVRKMEASGIEAVIVCVSEQYLGKEFLGRRIDSSLLRDLPPNVDPCGENGEYHSFVHNAPWFSSPIPIIAGDIVYKTYTPARGSQWDSGFFFLDVNAGA